jgi:hypothetical protein
MARLALWPDPHPPHRLVLMVGCMGVWQPGRLRLLRRVPAPRHARLGSRHALVRPAPRPLALAALSQALHPPAPPLAQSSSPSSELPPHAQSPSSSTRASLLQPPSRPNSKGLPAALRRCAPLRSTQLHLTVVVSTRFDSVIGEVGQRRRMHTLALTAFAAQCDALIGTPQQVVRTPSGGASLDVAYMVSGAMSASLGQTSVPPSGSARRCRKQSRLRRARTRYRGRRGMRVCGRGRRRATNGLPEPKSLRWNPLESGGILAQLARDWRARDEHDLRKQRTTGRRARRNRGNAWPTAGGFLRGRSTSSELSPVREQNYDLGWTMASARQRATSWRR